MTNEQFLKNLSVPSGKVDIVLDTDAFNEIDDQFAIVYALKSSEKINVKGITAAPFFNTHSASPKEGMEKSYDEILKLLKLAECEEYLNCVYKGSEKYLENENTPVESSAADYIAKLADEYSPEKPLYIVAIGAITNVASAILKNPNVKENCVVVWLGGHAMHVENPANEFNMVQDIAAARVVFCSGVPLVLLPCVGVVSQCLTSKYELKHWLEGKNAVSDYLYKNTVQEAESFSPHKTWTRVIWDVTVLSWILNSDKQMYTTNRLIPRCIPEYDGTYSFNNSNPLMCYVERINRDAIFEDLFLKLTK